MKLKNLKKETKVRIKSKGEYLLLMNLLEKAGYKWASGDSATTFNNKKSYYEMPYIVLHPSSMTITYEISDDDIGKPLRKVVKYEVGDKVRIRKDLAECNVSEYPSITPKMLQLAGMVGSIESIDVHYIIDISEYSWLKKWLEPVIEEEQKYYNGKIIFTKGDITFKTGHIYKVEDGKIIANGKTYPFVYPDFKTIEDIKTYFNKDTKHGWSGETLELIEVLDD